MKKQHFISFFILCSLLFFIAPHSKPIDVQAANVKPIIMKVKPSHATAVYKDNSQKSKKLFHTKANRHVIVHNVRGDWSYIQDGQKFGYIASSSLTAAKANHATVSHPKHLLVRTTPSFKQSDIYTYKHHSAVNTYSYNKEWVIVQLPHTYSFAPANRVKKVAPLKVTKYSSGVVTKQKRVALTFDDGPNITYTPAILNTLKKYNVPATFFVTGQNVKRHPQIAKRIVDEGHEIGNHTYTHPKLTHISNTAVKNELQKTNAAIKKATGASPTVFRPPYGAYNQTTITHANLPTILWSIDTLDWKHRNAKKLLQSVKAQVQNGSIILMHDLNNGTKNGLESVIIYLQKEGYDIVTVSDILTP